jgi:hypothetical protein
MVRSVCRLAFLVLISLVAYGVYAPKLQARVNNCYIEVYSDLQSTSNFPFLIFQNAFQSFWVDAPTTYHCQLFATTNALASVSWGNCYLNPDGFGGYMRPYAWDNFGVQWVNTVGQGYSYNCCSTWGLNC